MRIASKNEIIVLLGNKTTEFATFCISPDGTTLKFLFDNATSFDLDEPVVSGMVAQLHQAGVIDTACAERFAVFGQAVPEPVPIQQHTYIADSSFPIPLDAHGYYDVDDIQHYWFLVPYQIEGLKEVNRYGIY